MRKLLKSIIFAFLAIPAMAQIPAPQINLGGNIGCQGFPCLNNGTLQFTGDADRNMTVQETSATGGIKVTSTVPLTATRNLILPTGNFQFIAVENATTGGQSIQVIGQSGTGVTIANGASATVWFDGTNVVQTGSSSSSGPILQTNGTNNGSQTTLNLVSGTGATVTNSGANVTISASGSGSTGAQGTVQVAGSTSGTFQASTPAYVATSLISPALNAFRTALYTSSTFPGTPSTSTNVLLIGTSITCCIGPANYLDSPGSQIKSTLQQFGLNGTGIIPVGDNGTTSTRPEWTLAGTWTTVPDLGPNQTNSNAIFNSMFVASGNGAGNTLTMANQSGDTLLLYAETTTDSGGCSVSVDGGGAATFANTTSVSPTMTLTSFSPGPGNHTIVVQPSGAGKCYFYGAQWQYSNTSGVILNNIAHGYATTNAYCASPSTQMAMVPLLNPAPSLAIIELGVNEIIEGTINQSTYATQMQACTTYLRSINPNMSILYLDDYNINPASIGTGITYAQVRASEQALATANNAAYMSVGDSWGTYAQANALGLMYSDGVHPTNLGGVNYGALVASYITLGINNLPLNTIKPFVMQQAYPANISNYPLLSASSRSASKLGLTSGINLYASGSSSYALGLDLGINTVTQDYGPRLYNNQGSSNSSSDVIFQHYVNTAGYPSGQGTAAGWIQDGYVESSDQSFHMVGPITGAGYTITGNQEFTGVQGTTGVKLPAATGSFTSNNLRSTNSTGDEVDSGIAASNVPLLNASNTFTQAQTINGSNGTLNLTATGSGGTNWEIDSIGSTSIGSCIAGSLAFHDTSGDIPLCFEAGDTAVIPLLSTATIKVSTSITNAPGMQVASGVGCATTGSGVAACNATLTLPVTEPDTAYKVMGCTISNTTGGGWIGNSSSLTNTGFSVSEFSPTSGTTGGTINCLVVHN